MPRRRILALFDPLEPCHRPEAVVFLKSLGPGLVTGAAGIRSFVCGGRGLYSSRAVSRRSDLEKSQHADQHCNMKAHERADA
jgi:hypothetical protein